MKLLVCFLLISSILFGQSKQENKSTWKFDFGTGNVQKGFIQVLPTSLYEKKKGFGFLNTSNLKSIDYKGKNALSTDFISGTNPFVFAVQVPEGNYDVTVFFGDEKGTSSATVRAECRRLMVEPFKTANGEIIKKEFTVNIRKAIINLSGDSVKLKKREHEYFHWDNLLTLEFNGETPKICGIEITKNDKAITLFLAGNSTVVDQASEPYASWGQMIPSFFDPGKIAISNHAESGETLKAFERERRLEKILSMIKKSDYLFIEFAHNDQKPGGNHLDPFTTYKETLKRYIEQVREKGAIPVLVTSMHRRKFDGSGMIVNSLGDYPEALRQTGIEENVSVIDLNSMSKKLYEAWGEEKSLKAFVHYPAGSFPNQSTELKVNTHFSPYGAYELAKCILEGIRKSDLEIVKYIKKEIKPFDPSIPDEIDSFYWPLSPHVSILKPDGN